MTNEHHTTVGIVNNMQIDDILANASVLINGERQESYGEIENSWQRIGIIWGALLDIEPIEPHLVGIMLAGMKLSRVVTDPTHEDNFIDGAAYIAGAGAIATEA